MTGVVFIYHGTMCKAKASKRLYFLKQLKRAGVPPQQLLYFYATVIRPVLEYCAPVWHYAITRSQAEQLESIQKRAIHIIYPFDNIYAPKIYNR